MWSRLIEWNSSTHLKEGVLCHIWDNQSPLESTFSLWATVILHTCIWSWCLCMYMQVLSIGLLVFMKVTQQQVHISCVIYICEYYAEGRTFNDIWQWHLLLQWSTMERRSAFTPVIPRHRAEDDIKSHDQGQFIKDLGGFLTLNYGSDDAGSWVLILAQL